MPLQYVDGALFMCCVLRPHPQEQAPLFQLLLQMTRVVSAEQLSALRPDYLPLDPALTTLREPKLHAD